MSQSPKPSDSIYRPDWQWLGRSLANYKSMQMNTARSKGVAEKLVAATTLTEARKIVYGHKSKNTR